MPTGIAAMTKLPAVEPANDRRVLPQSAGEGGTRCERAPLLAIPGEANGLFPSVARTPFRESDTARMRWNGMQQFFAVDLRAGQAIRITLDDRGNFDAAVHVLARCGESFSGTVDGRVSSPAPVLTFAAPETGRYVIAVDASLGDRGGSYTLKVAVVPR